MSVIRCSPEHGDRFRLRGRRRNLTSHKAHRPVLREASGYSLDHCGSWCLLFAALEVGKKFPDHPAGIRTVRVVEGMLRVAPAPGMVQPLHQYLSQQQGVPTAIFPDFVGITV